MIVEAYKANFETLRSACEAGRLALMECTDAKTGKPVYTVCAVNAIEDGYEFVPVAKMFDGNPYEEILPPMPASTGWKLPE